ncbi:MAG: NAD(+) synthase, partial [Candidatus Sumerlaeaceae bacterium]|nr:NAD(+) synthase [Candidatus Sumerlaeaceae bacterium]
RLHMIHHTAERWGMPVLMVNQVGGCDEVVFDGGSAVVRPNGSVACCCGWFEENITVWDLGEVSARRSVETVVKPVEEEVSTIRQALLLGLRDYLKKTGFAQVLVGNSGGIDSAVVVSLAVEAVGAENVISVSMPGPFTSQGTHDDSAELARRQGVRHIDLPIAGPYEVMADLLEGPDSKVIAELFGGAAGKVSRLANENLQARLRGNILMWLSNAFSTPRTLLLSTGNKSEIAVGYCTLYGDMAGGLALISDVPKTMVYKLARLINATRGDVIPQSIIDREPTAELAPNQKDSDSLPPYPVLDEIIRLHVEEFQSAEEIIDAGVAPAETVRRVLRMIDNAEYKRKQAAPGIKVTSKAFGVGRRMPIARG